METKAQDTETYSVPLTCNHTNVACCLNQRWDLTAVRNRLRSQTPPTCFTLSYVMCWLSCSALTRLSLYPRLIPLLFDSSTHRGYRHHPVALWELTILTVAKPNQLYCVCEAESRLWVISDKQTQLCFSGTGGSEISAQAEKLSQFLAVFQTSIFHNMF